jgi:hypothetical protein
MAALSNRADGEDAREALLSTDDSIATPCSVKRYGA